MKVRAEVRVRMSVKSVNVNAIISQRESKNKSERKRHSQKGSESQNESQRGDESMKVKFRAGFTVNEVTIVIDRLSVED